MTHPITWLGATALTLLVMAYGCGTAVAASTGYGSAQGVSGGDSADQSSQLPFTGLAVTPLIIAGLVLVALGAALVRRDHGTNR